MPLREGDCPAILKINREPKTVLPLLPRSGSVQQIAAGNAGWPVQFRYRGGCHQPRVPELWTLIWLTFVKQVVCLRSEIFHILSVYYTANYSESETGTL
jgi:hypothetical protein